MFSNVASDDGIVELIRKIKPILQRKNEYNADEERDKKYKDQDLSVTKKSVAIYSWKQ